MLPPNLPLSLDKQAFDAFFSFYVSGCSKTWHFLVPYYDEMKTPAHLQESLKAVSLAFFAHQVHSDAAVASARQKYGSALSLTAKAIKDPVLALKDDTILSSILLDLFEKFTNTAPSDIATYTGHVQGALALVKLRGLQTFNDSAGARLLVRLATNLLISCVASATRAPEGLYALRLRAAEIIKETDPKWQLSYLMLDYANLRGDVKDGVLTLDERISRTISLEARMQAQSLRMPPTWQYKTNVLEVPSPRVFDERYDTYKDRHVTQTQNVNRLVRIILNDDLIDYYDSGPATPATEALTAVARNNIEQLCREICFSVPQFIDCGDIAKRNKRYTNEGETCDHHSALHNLDCYSLIFPLYVAGHSPRCRFEMKQWIVNQLKHIGEHFRIRNAEDIGTILDQGLPLDGWAIYGMLGSYAFAA